jgi:hypothetical protein
MSRFLQTLYSGKKAPSRSRPTPSYRPTLEALEDRLVPSTLTVTNPADNGAMGSLRYEVNLANADSARGISDTIVFSNNVVGTYAGGMAPSP